jgi:protein-L-isoaspartate(D-aspartate) O-methyltransferase
VSGKLRLTGLRKAVELESQREALVQSLRADVEDERVLAAFRAVPRESFVLPEFQRLAYENRPLPIGYGQTISQPLMVALMIDALELGGDERVLDIGTGSGYQAALLSRLARQIVSVELIPGLAKSSKRRLETLGYSNVEVHVAGKELGWPPGAPYDAIVVAAGARRVPRSLIGQLAMGGRLVVPVGGRTSQMLVRATKSDRGITLERLGECRFVPLIAEDEGWPEWEHSGNGRTTIR